MLRSRLLMLGLAFVLTGCAGGAGIGTNPLPHRASLLSPILAAAAAPPAQPKWKTYISTHLHLAVDYPPDWTVRAEDSGAVFSSPQGVTIRLEPSAQSSGDEIIQPNTRCSTGVNPHGIRVRTCYATIGAAIDAYLDWTSAGGAASATITTRTRAALAVFSALVASARIVP